MLLEDKKQAIDQLVLIPSGGGRFEVTVDGKRIWSKKETKKFPQYSQIAEALPE